MELVYFIQFKAQTTPGLIASIVETNLRESSEFIQALPEGVYGIFAIFVGSFIYLYYQSKNIPNSNSNRKLTVLFLLIPLFDFGGKGATSHSFPLGVLRASYVYANDIFVSYQLTKQRKDFIFDASFNSTHVKENYVFVLGETSRRDYYSIYGYPRETNPKLSKYKLAIFRDVISPSNATIPSLASMLYMATVVDDSFFYSSKSIVSLAKEAGYETYWLSSQSRFGEFDSKSASTGIEANNTTFINRDRAISRVYDEELLPFLNTSFKDKESNKFIVMHLYGNHFAYNQRYPEGYDIFKGSPPGYKNRSTFIKNKINEYSNSIYYTDFVLSQIIDATASQRTPSCVVYTSDHGEYLADTAENDFIGHGYPIPHKQEIEVPLIVWCSKEYHDLYPNKWKNILSNQDAKISNEDLFFSLADLLRISFKSMRLERSFFGRKYSPPKVRKVISSSNKKIFNYSELE